MPKRIEILKALAPSVSRVLSAYHPDDPASLAAVKKAQTVAAEFKVTVLDRALRDPADVERVMKELQPGDGLLPPDLASLAIPGRSKTPVGFCLLDIGRVRACRSYLI